MTFTECTSDKYGIRCNATCACVNGATWNIYLPLPILHLTYFPDLIFVSLQHAHLAITVSNVTPPAHALMELNVMQQMVTVLVHQYLKDRTVTKVCVTFKTFYDMPIKITLIAIYF